MRTFEKGTYEYPSPAEEIKSLAIEKIIQSAGKGRFFVFEKRATKAHIRIKKICRFALIRSFASAYAK